MIWLQFALCAGLIGTAGFQLTRYGDVIAQHTGLSGSWIGLALLATVTSLPELATGITSVTLAQAPNVAVGNALGSCMLNLAFLVLLDLLCRKEPVWRRADQGHVLAAAFGVVLLGLMMVSLLASHLAPATTARLPVLADFGFGLTTPLVLGLYLVAMRSVFVYECAHAPPSPTLQAQREALPSLRRALTGFAMAAAVVVGAGLWLPFVALELAAAMGWSRSFVGSLFVALVTTLPELAVTLSALRLGALDMAVGNLLGSNLFNVAIIALDDLFYRPGSLLADASPVHAITAGSAVMMTGLAMVGLFFRPRSRVLQALSWVSLAMMAVYLFTTYLLYLHGD
jgi:cation:H+ antiporter